MDEKKIQSILQDALEEEIPPSEIRLWSGIRDHLVAGKNTSNQQGEKMNGTQLHHLQRVALTVLMMAALATLAFVTPQGRVLAQNVLELFRRSDSYERPLPTEHIPSTEDAAAPTAMPPAPLVSIAEAEALAGFNAAELASVPDGFQYLGARYMEMPFISNMEFRVAEAISSSHNRKMALSNLIGTKRRLNLLLRSRSED